TPVAPSLDPSMMDVPAILYYSDVTMDLGPTYVVSRQHTQDVPLFPGTRPRSAENAALYEHEKPVLAKAGSLLLYSMHTFHRGSRMTAACGHRFTHHLGFHNGACRWQGTYSFHFHAEAPQYARLIERSTPQQRWALGFPPPGHVYWDEQSLKLVALRYPKID